MVWAGEIKDPGKFTPSAGSGKTAVLKRSAPRRNPNHRTGDGWPDRSFRHRPAFPGIQASAPVWPRANRHRGRRFLLARPRCTPWASSSRPNPSRLSDSRAFPMIGRITSSMGVPSPSGEAHCPPPGTVRVRRFQTARPKSLIPSPNRSGFSASRAHPFSRSSACRSAEHGWRIREAGADR